MWFCSGYIPETLNKIEKSPGLFLKPCRRCKLVSIMKLSIFVVHNSKIIGKMKEAFNENSGHAGYTCTNRTLHGSEIIKSNSVPTNKQNPEY